jgi:hypothetical protein
MALATTIVEADGKTTTYDVTSRSSRTDAGEVWWEITINDVIEFPAVTRTACFTSCLVNTNTISTGQVSLDAANTPSSRNGGVNPRGFSRTVSYGSKESTRQVGGYTHTRTVETVIEFRTSGALQPVTINPAGGYPGSYPYNVTLTRVQGSKIKWSIRDLYGANSATQTAEGESTSASVVVSLTGPRILFVWAEDSTGTTKGQCRVAFFT